MSLRFRVTLRDDDLPGHEGEAVVAIDLDRVEQLRGTPAGDKAVVAELEPYLLELMAERNTARACGPEPA